MDPRYLLTVVPWIAIAILVIYRQFTIQPLRGLPLIVLPLLLRHGDQQSHPPAFPGAHRDRGAGRERRHRRDAWLVAGEQHTDVAGRQRHHPPAGHAAHPGALAGRDSAPGTHGHPRPPLRQRRQRQLRGVAALPGHHVRGPELDGLGARPVPTPGGLMVI